MNVICFISLLESHSEDLPLFLCQVMVIVETDLVVFTLIEPFRCLDAPWLARLVQGIILSGSKVPALITFFWDRW